MSDQRWKELAEKQFSDPLVRRIFARTQPELKRAEIENDIWNQAHYNAAINDFSPAGATLFATICVCVWAVLCAIYDEIVSLRKRLIARKKKQQRPKRTRLKVHFHEI